jgi:hypothetical protein
MGPTARHFEVPQGSHQALFFYELYQTRLIAINYDQIRIDAECIHVEALR